jgi:lipid-A-disaccharide synthase
MSTSDHSVLIVAAEASSSLYAQRLLELWQKSGRTIDAFGIGSRAMEKRGFECLGRSEELAVVGVVEVVKHFPLIRDVFHRLLEEAEKRKPKFALLLDYPDFNLRLAKELKKRGIKVVYYISPQVWAWRSGRVKQIREVVDHMLVLFPFEEKFYRENGVKADFVGHPLLDEVPDIRSAKDRFVHRQKFGIADDDFVLGLMPGSRRSEIQHHLEVQLKTAAILHKNLQKQQLAAKSSAKFRTVLMVAPTLERADVQDWLKDYPYPIQVIKEDPLEMIDLADVILVASGTATLMVGLMQKPMVIMYRMNSLTAWLAKKLVTKTKFFGLVNLIMDRMVAPELFQEEANPDRLAEELNRYMSNSKFYAQAVDELGQLKAQLGSKGATEKVAHLLDGYWA